MLSHDTELRSVRLKGACKPVTTRHCLSCGILIADHSRCRHCTKALARIASRKGRAKRGIGWSKTSRQLRQRWRDYGFGCAMSNKDCRGLIQADHLSIPGAYQPLCAFHNNQKH